MSPEAGSNTEKVVMPWEKQYMLQPIQVAEGLGVTSETPKSPRPLDPWEREFTVKKGVVPMRPSYNFTNKPTQGKNSQGGFNMEEYTDKLTATESGGNANAKATTSSATGPHQFIESTWNETVAKMGVDYTLDDRTNRAKSSKVLQQLTKDNIEKAKEDLGRPPTMMEAYLYHFVGKSAPRLIQAPPDAPAKDYITASQYKANKSVFEGKTVKDVLDKYGKRFK